MASASENMQVQLIEAVQKEVCLYNVKNADYLNFKLKESIWQRIAKQLKIRNGNEAKKLWEKLRNNHRDALRRQRHVKQRNKSDVVKPWRFQDNMAFLIPHMGYRTGNKDAHEDEHNDEPSQIAGQPVARGYTEEILLHDSDSDNEVIYQNYQPPRLSSTDSSDSDTSTDEVHKRKRQKTKPVKELPIKTEERPQRASDKLQTPAQLVEPPTTNINHVVHGQSDSLFHFFMSMYETAKTLPPRSQHDIKTKIFSLVSQEEYKVLYPGETVLADAATDTLSIPTIVKQQPIEFFPEETP